jgi:hypothetical protein
MIKRWLIALTLLSGALHYGIAEASPVPSTPQPVLNGQPLDEPRAFLSAPTTTTAPAVASTSLPSAKPKLKWVTIKVDGTLVSIPKDKTYRCPKLEPSIREAGLKPVAVWSYISWRESRCQPKAIGWNYKAGKSHRDCRLAPASIYKRCSAIRSYDSGALQINSTWKTVTAQVCHSEFGNLEVLRKVDCNLAVAKYLFDNGGLGHWGF